MLLNHNKLKELVVKIFTSNLLKREDAETVAELLIEAELIGVKTHGLSRLSNYILRLRKGITNPKPNIKEIISDGPLGLIDGDHGQGQVIGITALNLATKKCEKYGISYVGVRNSGHLGALGLLSKRIAAKNMIGIVTSNTSPAMAPTGATHPFLGNNPIAISIPNPNLNEDPYTLDFALSITARGNIILANREGREIPLDWAIDSSGKPTSNPEEALAGAILPLGAHKGSGLAIMIEILAGVLNGSHYGSGVASMEPPDLTRPLGYGNIFFCLDPSRLMKYEEFNKKLIDYITQLRSQPKAVGVEEILLPGEREAVNFNKNMNNGLELSEATLRDLLSLATDAGIEANLTGLLQG